MVVKLHGKALYQVAVVHGGPGTCISMSLVAQRMSNFFGVIETIQSEKNIPELVDELALQIKSVTNLPITMIGHSWGAWLSVLFAAKYPERIKKLILIAAAPFHDRYANEIMPRRFNRLAHAEVDMCRKLMKELGNPDTKHDETLSKLSQIFEKSDNYDPFPHTEVIDFIGNFHKVTWPEACAMRKSGELLYKLAKVKCPIAVVHGEEDPYPINGALTPLLQQGHTPDVYRLSHCGHNPFNEKQVIDRFYDILVKSIPNA